MRIFQDTFETRKRSFISAFSIGMTVPLKSIICFFSKKTSAFLEKYYGSNQLRFLLIKYARQECDPPEATLERNKLPLHIVVFLHCFSF